MWSPANHSSVLRNLRPGRLLVLVAAAVEVVEKGSTHRGDVDDVLIAARRAWHQRLATSARPSRAFP